LQRFGRITRSCIRLVVDSPGVGVQYANKLVARMSRLIVANLAIRLGYDGVGDTRYTFASRLHQ
jgi:hypothetical protein